MAVGKLKVAAVNNEAIPSGWAVDGRGLVTSNPKTQDCYEGGGRYSHGWSGGDRRLQGIRPRSDG